MISYKGAGNGEMAKRHEALFPHDTNEQQAVRMHGSATRDGGRPLSGRSIGGRR